MYMYDVFSAQASDVELSKLSESHRISHHQAGSAIGNAAVEEHDEGITAGIGTLHNFYTGIQFLISKYRYVHIHVLNSFTAC